MCNKLIYSISFIMLLSVAVSVQAEVVISTADGNGADTSLENDGQSGSHGPDSVHGADGYLAIRNYEGVRQKFLYVRFDLTGIAGDLTGATLSFNVTNSNRNRNWLIYGLVDGADDLWDEATTSYNTAPGIIPNPPTALGSFALDENKLQLLGTISILENTPTRETPTTYTSNATDLSLDSFLSSDTNKLVTFAVINENSDSSASYWITAKEGDPTRAPKLTLPNAALSAAMDPNPADKAEDIIRDGVVLSWTPGASAVSHDVYFGTEPNNVQDASRANSLGVLASQGQDSNALALGRLDFNQTYYWRVDEVSGSPDPIYEGSVWSFTVEPISYAIVNITATASSSSAAYTGPEKTIDGSGLNENDQHSSIAADMWQSSVTGPQPTWIKYEFDKEYKLHEMWVWNSNQSLENVVGLGLRNVTIEYSSDDSNWTQLGDVPEFNQATGLDDYTYNTIVDFNGAVAKYVRITANSNWGDLLPQYSLSEVRFFYIPVRARLPQPASGGTGVALDAVLSWRAGREAASHNVYFSDSNQAVIDGTAAVTNVTEASYGPLSLDLGKTYYWQVNEVNEAETPAIWQGDVWNFTAQEYLVVDDFEDYNDFEPDRVFDTWIDGWGVPANGSQVGSDVPPFAEQTIVHGGQQSMPLSYDNSTASYSEATANVANLPVGQDWTRYGIQTLSLWFYGDPTNAAEQMYVKVNGIKVVYGGDVTDIQSASWHEWNIGLASFGVNLSNVTELIIGLERSGAVGGTGVVFLDDIRLYPARVEE